MLEEFTKRCLYKSINFINNCNINVEKSFLLTNKDQELITLFNTKDYSLVTDNVCIVNCDCCTNSHKFLGFYSKRILKTILKIKYKEERNLLESNDIFLAYLAAFDLKGREKTNLLLKILQHNCYFYECFDEILYNTEISNYFQVEAGIEEIEDEILKRIYFMLIFVWRFIRTDKFEMYFNDLLYYFKITEMKQQNDKENINQHNRTFKTKISPKYSPYIISLLAAVYYTLKDYEKATLLFKKSCLEINTFLDLYSNILFINSDSRTLSLLFHKLIVKFPFKPELYIILANYYSLTKNHEKAIECFLKSIEMDERFSCIYTLIAHEYEMLKDYNNVLLYYNNAVKFNRNDYRALYGLAEYYNKMGMNKMARIFYKKVCEVQPDNTHFLLKYADIVEEDEKIMLYEKVVKMGDCAGYFKLGEFYKLKNETEHMVFNYEKYVEKKDDKSIIEFLKEYYFDRGDMKRFEYYSKKY